MARQRSEAEKTKWVARWKASGLGREKFARQHNLTPSSLYAWTKKYGEGASGSAAFTEVRVVGAPEAAVEVRLCDGRSVRLTGAVDEATLRMVLRVAAEC